MVTQLSVRSAAELRRLDEAARAGWLYYVADNTQEEIARKLGVSRQSAQRMVSLAVSEGLIKVRLDHPIARCMELSLRLKDRFRLISCDIVPSDENDPTSIAGLGQAGAAAIERFLKSDDSVTVAMGTGRSLVASVNELSPMVCPQHRVVSMLGNMLMDGSASAYDVVTRVADHINAKHFPMALPVLAQTPKEKKALQRQEHVRNVLQIARQADVTFVGVGNVGTESPLVHDGFVTRKEMKELERAGAVGEIISWVYDQDGRLIKGHINERVASAPLRPDPERPVVAIAAGDIKVAAILGALRGKLVNSLITNERTAELILDND